MRVLHFRPRLFVLVVPTSMLLCSVPCSLVRADAAATAWPLDVRLEFRAATFGTSIGEAGLHAVDLDGDGKLEIVAAAAGGAAHFWYVLARRGSGYRQSWVSRPFADTIESLTVANLDADPAPEVLVGTGNRILVYDGATRELQWAITTSASAVRSLQVADVDSDAVAEAVFCDDTGLYVHDAVNGAPEVQSLLDACAGVAVGNVDEDPGLEIVVGNGTATGYVLDGATRATEWAYPLGFGVMVRVGDLDGDSIGEIVAAQAWSQISVLDAVSKVEEDAVYPSHDIGGMEVADVEGDGPKELLYGDGQWGDIHVLNGATLAQKWAVQNPEHGVTNVIVADTDGDGVREIVWGAGHTSSGPDHLYVADSVTQQIEWENLDFNGPYYGLAHGDVGGDGRPAFLFTSFASDSGYNDGRYFVHGAVNKQLRYVSSPPTGLNWTGLVRVAVANVDADPQLEVLVGTSYLYQGILICYDGLTHAEQWRAPVEEGLSIWSLQVADVDADGQLEAVIGTRREHTGAPGVFVYAINASTGAQEWRSPSVTGGFGALSLLRLAQVDTDPALEILVAEYEGRLFMFDGITHGLTQLFPDGVTALDTQPRRGGGGRSDVVVGTTDGDLFTIRPGRPAAWVARYGAQIDGLDVRDLNGDGIPDYVFAVADVVSIVDGRDGRTLWQSERLAGDSFFSSVGVNDSLLVADIDLDGRPEIMVNTGRVGVDIYEVPAL
jgi:hypothetical protein